MSQIPVLGEHIFRKEIANNSSVVHQSMNNFLWFQAKVYISCILVVKLYKIN